MNWIRLLKDIPLRFNEERSDQLTHGHPDGYRRIYLSSHLGIICPPHWLVIGIWKFHVFSRKGRTEFLQFLDLAEGCTRLLDLGASAGIFSAFFATSRKHSEIVSVEPDLPSFDLLAETIEANKRAGGSWKRERIVIGDRNGSIRFSSSGLGGNVVPADQAGEDLPMETLATLCERLQFVPEIIKVDVESFEYEALAGSLDWLKKTRPRLKLELHWNLLLQRGKDPAAFLRLLESAGLKLAHGGGLSRITARHLERDGCVRLALDWK